ncbi:MAG: heavy-metal-associated domain-containing protein, partial [Planctomycetes bacterium]|nr:heavy-metal-associated domain-containing protein [Planctomycetota bacterium]
AVAGGGHDCCTTEPSEGEDCCAPVAKGRISMMMLNKVMLWVVTVMAVGFLLFPSYVGMLIGGSNGMVVTENMNRAVIQVEGMTCEGCSAIVAKAIRNVPGVLAVEVDYGKGEAVVDTEICCPVPKDEIVTVLKKAGYGGIFVEESQRQ